ncbi:MAG: ATP-binding protein [Dethiobacteria bacterium]|jgi:MinD superfamily P-loop ATPase
MIIAVASGKGGTGKTTVAINLALVQDQDEVQFLDCDVEEPNAHIFLKPDLGEKETVSIPVPKIDEEKCTFCGRCAEVCAFNALVVLKDHVMTFHELCHGCGGCAYFCPEKAITEVPRGIGILERGPAFGFDFLHGRLNPGEAMSPPLIDAVKNKIDNRKQVLIDAPPGTSCPVVAAVRGSDFCLLVTEPTPFGLNDLDLAVQLLRKLDIPVGVLINRADIGDKRVEEYCRREGVPVLMEIPFDRELATLYARGEPIVEHSAKWHDMFAALWGSIDDYLKTVENPTRQKGEDAG